MKEQGIPEHEQVREKEGHLCCLKKLKYKNRHAIPIVYIFATLNIIITYDYYLLFNIL